jgi:hypothetical protein
VLRTYSLLKACVVFQQRSARIESERAKQAFEIQQEAELTLSQKFKGIVSDLRRSWEEEETG